MCVQVDRNEDVKERRCKECEEREKGEKKGINDSMSVRIVGRISRPATILLIIVLLMIVFLMIVLLMIMFP